MKTVAIMKSATDKCPETLLPAHKRGCAGGQTTVEFALICIPFFAILFAIIDFAQIYFYENSMQNSLREAARFATAGSIIQAKNADGTPAFTNDNGVTRPVAISDSQGREASRNECIRYWFYTNCVLQGIPLSNIEVYSAPTLPGVPPVTSTNSLGQLTLKSGFTVTTNNGSVSTNVVAAVKGPGNANDYVQLTALYSVNTITPLVAAYGSGYSRQGWTVFPVRVSAIVKNEPALLNFQHTNMYGDEPFFPDQQ